MRARSGRSCRQHVSCSAVKTRNCRGYILAWTPRLRNSRFNFWSRLCEGSRFQARPRCRLTMAMTAGNAGIPPACRQVSWRVKPQPPPGYSGKQSSSASSQGSTVTRSSPDSDKSQSSCTDGYRPGGGSIRPGQPSSQTLHTMRGIRPALPGNAERPRGRNRPPRAGESIQDINSPATPAASVKRPGKKPPADSRQVRVAARLPEQRREVSDYSGFHPIRRRSDPKQIVCSPSKHPAIHYRDSRTNGQLHVQLLLNAANSDVDSQLA